MFALTLCLSLAGVALSGCASAPAPGSLEALKAEKRRELYRQCVSVTFREMHAEIAAGFYDGGDLARACGEWSRRMVR